MNPNNQAILFVILSTVFFALQDTAVKLLSETESIWQLMALRSALVILFLLFWIRLKGQWHDIVPRNLGWPIARAGFMCLAYTLSYSAYPFASLSDVAACFFTAPIFVCIFAALFLKESIGIWRILAVIIGFFGALLIIQPGSEEFRPVLIMPLLAGACYAAGVVVTRGFCFDHPSLSLTAIHNLFYAAVGFAVLSLIPVITIDPRLVAENPFLFRDWEQLAPAIFFTIVATAVLHIVAMTASIRAYQVAESTFVAPLEYSYLIFAAVIDFFIWAAFPSGTTLIGVTLVVGSGLLITLREFTARQSKIE